MKRLTNGRSVPYDCVKQAVVEACDAKLQPLVQNKANATVDVSITIHQGNHQTTKVTVSEWIKN